MEVEFDEDTVELEKRSESRENHFYFENGCPRDQSRGAAAEPTALKVLHRELTKLQIAPHS